MKNTFLLTVIMLLLMNALSCAQRNPSDRAGVEKKVGGQCEGCEAVFEFGDKQLLPADTLPDFNETGPKILLTGTIFHRDGKTPAKDVILYIYHTDQKGIYPTTGRETDWAKRHGYLRGWIKTGADGKYRFYTLKPAPYPDGNNPAHIHTTIKEPGYSEYYIDEILFDDDPLVTRNVRSSQENRCGSGIIKLNSYPGGLLIAQRDIILGLNIPDY